MSHLLFPLLLISLYSCTEYTHVNVIVFTRIPAWRVTFFWGWITRRCLAVFPRLQGRKNYTYSPILAYYYLVALILLQHPPGWCLLCKLLNLGSKILRANTCISIWWVIVTLNREFSTALLLECDSLVINWVFHEKKDEPQHDLCRWGRSALFCQNFRSTKYDRSHSQLFYFAVTVLILFWHNVVM